MNFHCGAEHQCVIEEDDDRPSQQIDWDIIRGKVCVMIIEP